MNGSRLIILYPSTGAKARHTLPAYAALKRRSSTLNNAALPLGNGSRCKIPAILISHEEAFRWHAILKC
jgi:hypothetical protein